MDPRTLLAIAVLFMLLNGAVLGLMRKSLSPDVRSSALDWLRGTLLMAGGLVSIAWQGRLPDAFVYPITNGVVLLGVAYHWRAMRQYCGLPARRWIWGPALAGTLAVLWLSTAMPHPVGRIFVASIVLAVYMAACAWTLHGRGDAHAESARYVLIAIFAISAVVFGVRGVYLLRYAADQPALLAPEAWINVVMMVFVTALPVIGTTAFLLMCADRLRLQWERAAAIDYLTGLPNRRTIMATGAACIDDVRRRGRRLAVAVIDIDHFKSINDRYGHEAGDEVLKAVAVTLDENSRGPRLVGRHGGEEFVALIEDATPAEARQVAERLRTAVEAQSLHMGTSRIAMTVSIGVGFLEATDRLFEDVLRRADQALYAAKSGGRNRVC